ncbi:MerC domain-containing protein [Candidatus Uhrbacteria bacterium]|nr:MerC domain-containing protein [Candidatus Uhrbacteria bacterium]
MRTQKSAGSLLTVLGGIFGVLCPACVPVVGTFLTTIGLGILADLVVSRTLMLVLLAFALIALHVSALVHRRSVPFVLAVVASMGMILGRNVILNVWLINGSGALLLLASCLDYWYRRQTVPAVCPVAPQRTT